MSRRTAINTAEFAALPTLITNFMGVASSNLRTFSDLARIFVERELAMTDDPADDLRIRRFADDMTMGRWNGTVEVTQHSGIVVDGVLRRRS